MRHALHKTASALVLASCLLASSFAALAAPPMVVIPASGGSVTAGQLPATATNDSATAGNLGEDLTAAAAGVSLTTGTPATVTSKSLTAGDLLVFCTFQFTGNSATTVRRIMGSLSTTTNTINSTAGFRSEDTFNTNTAYALGNPSLIVGPNVVKLTSTTPYYCVAQSEFGASTTTVSAQLTAIRIR